MEVIFPAQYKYFAPTPGNFFQLNAVSDKSQAWAEKCTEASDSTAGQD